MKETFKFKSEDWNQNNQELIQGIFTEVGQVDFTVLEEKDGFVSVQFAEAGELNSSVSVIVEKPVIEGEVIEEKPGEEKPEMAVEVELKFDKMAAMKLMTKIGEKEFSICCVEAVAVESPKEIDL